MHDIYAPKNIGNISMRYEKRTESVIVRQHKFIDMVQLEKSMCIIVMYEAIGGVIGAELPW